MPDPTAGVDASLVPPRIITELLTTRAVAEPIQRRGHETVQNRFLAQSGQRGVSNSEDGQGGLRCDRDGWFDVRPHLDSAFDATDLEAAHRLK